MANNLGQVAIVGKGNWNSETTYYPKNMVTCRGGAFLCTAENTDKEPGNLLVHDWQDYWLMIADGINTASVTASSSTSFSFSFNRASGTVSVIPLTMPNLTIAPGYVDNAKLATDAVQTGNIKDGAVTVAKLATTGTGAITPGNVGIKAGTSVPTSGTGANQISSGQIYIKYA